MRISISIRYQGSRAVVGLGNNGATEIVSENTRKKRYNPIEVSS